jgi:hypothetical protein
MVVPTFLRFTAICFLSASLPSTLALSAVKRAAHTSSQSDKAELFGRQDLTCAFSGYTACNKAGLPGNFCCPSSHTCEPFNSGQSAICCPPNSNCSTIAPIECDINKQNATAFPSSRLYTTDLSSTMDTCAGKCCPSGYKCDGTNCVLSSSPAPTTSASPSSTSTTKSDPTTSSATTSPSPSASGTAGHSASTQAPAAQAHCSQFTTAGVLVGFFSGLAVGILLTILLMCCFGHRSYKKEMEPYPTTPDFSSSVAATVSDPIYQPHDANAFRSDFLRRESTSKFANRTSRVRSLFSRTPTLKSMRSREAPVDGIGRSIPVPPRTPDNQRSPDSTVRKEPSMESIRIYSPPNGGLGRPNTTFTDMMADAGFKHGEPYLGSPGRGEYPGKFRDV